MPWLRTSILVIALALAAIAAVVTINHRDAV